MQKYIIVFGFAVWPGARTLALRLISVSDGSLHDMNIKYCFLPLRYADPIFHAIKLKLVFIVFIFLVYMKSASTYICMYIYVYVHYKINVI